MRTRTNGRALRATLVGGTIVLALFGCGSDDREADVIDDAQTAGSQNDASADQGGGAGEGGHGAGGQGGDTGGNAGGGGAGVGGSAGGGGTDAGITPCETGADCSTCPDYLSCATCFGIDNPNGLRSSHLYLVQACVCEQHDGGAPICATACRGAGNYDCANIDATMDVTAACAECLNALSSDPCVAIWNAKCQADAACWSYATTLGTSCTKP